MGNKKLLLIAGGLFVLAAVFWATPATAAVTDLLPDPNTAGVPPYLRTENQIISLIFNTLITISGAIFMVLLVIGGLQYMASAGNEDASTRAKKLLLDAIIGLVIVLSAYAAGSWIIGRLTGQTTSGAPSGTGGGGENLGVGVYEWTNKLPDNTWYDIGTPEESRAFFTECNGKNGNPQRRFSAQNWTQQHKCPPSQNAI